MSILLLSIASLVLVVAVMLLFFRPYHYGAEVTQIRKIGDELDPDSDSADTQWRSVQIRPGLIRCDQVESMRDQVFLSREAPELPLMGCIERNCTCHYLFKEDRRSGLDRRAELAKLKGVLPSFDRRRSPGRRVGDLMPA